MSDPRPEGVYCRWEPLGEFFPNHEELVIEKVWGDGSVTEFRCTHGEAREIIQAISSYLHASSVKCEGCQRERPERVGNKWLHVTSGCATECTGVNVAAEA